MAENKPRENNVHGKESIMFTELLKINKQKTHFFTKKYKK